jgi:hypothetical protein
MSTVPSIHGNKRRRNVQGWKRQMYVLKMKEFTTMSQWAMAEASKESHKVLESVVKILRKYDDANLCDKVCTELEIILEQKYAGKVSK